ncbi:hypothetical protein [Kitasatospora camelliae]|uniref:Uncharacterized protein n=1 Tax=Kitasatospora camelliae TaxID=3156397 RepID=A0AAU8K6L9_9ACTN
MLEVTAVGALQGGAAGLVALIVLLILRGNLVPRSVLDDVRADRDARLAELAAERDTWREAHKVSEEARHVAQDQAGELLELSRTADYFLRSLPRAGEVTNGPDTKVDETPALPAP